MSKNWQYKEYTLGRCNYENKNFIKLKIKKR